MFPDYYAEPRKRKGQTETLKDAFPTLCAKSRKKDTLNRNTNRHFSLPNYMQNR